MPSRNVLKIDIAESYYHVYARGASRKEIYLDGEDYTVFLSLLKRYLSKTPSKDALGREYHHFFGTVELLAFCLMPNHFHLLFYQRDTQAISGLMRSILTTYSRYFNKKYSRSGPLFESRYKSSRVSNDTYLMHISRYIHLNPKKWRAWGWSSLPYYIRKKQAEWIDTSRIQGLFSDQQDYESFVADYQDNQRVLEIIKHELAGQ